MSETYELAYFFGGVFLANAIPHMVSGITGRAFQTPFAKPPGIGLSSSVVNIIWGFFNLLMAYLLIFHTGTYDIYSLSDFLATFSGAFFISLFCTYHFGKFHGGEAGKK